MFSLNNFIALFVDCLLSICIRQNDITHMIILDRLRYINSINLVPFQFPRIMLYIDAFYVTTISEKTVRVSLCRKLGL